MRVSVIVERTEVDKRLIAVLTSIRILDIVFGSHVKLVHVNSRIYLYTTKCTPTLILRSTVSAIHVRLTVLFHWEPYFTQ